MVALHLRCRKCCDRKHEDSRNPIQATTITTTHHVDEYRISIINMYPLHYCGNGNGHESDKQLSFTFHSYRKSAAPATAMIVLAVVSTYYDTLFWKTLRIVAILITLGTLQNSIPNMTKDKSQHSKTT